MDHEAAARPAVEHRVDVEVVRTLPGPQIRDREEHLTADAEGLDVLRAGRRQPEPLLKAIRRPAVDQRGQVTVPRLDPGLLARHVLGQLRYRQVRDSAEAEQRYAARARRLQRRQGLLPSHPSRHLQLPRVAGFIGSAEVTGEPLQAVKRPLSAQPADGADSALGGISLVSTKLHPPAARRGGVVRRSLLDRLAEDMPAKLVLVAALRRICRPRRGRRWPRDGAKRDARTDCSHGSFPRRYGDRG